MTKIDMTNGYWQFPIAPAEVGLTGFVTSQGHYRWRYIILWLQNAPSTFSRLVAKVFQGLEDFVKSI